MQKKLEKREDVALLLLDIIRPLKGHYSEGHAWLHVGDTGAHYGVKAARMEGFARVLWGLGPLWCNEYPSLPKEARDEIEQWRQLYLDGIRHGTDKTHKEYWGSLTDYDQKMVEMAAIANALLLAPEVFWEPLTTKQRQNVYSWLNQINAHNVHPNNWRFFRVLVNMLFQKLGLPANRECIQDDFKVIEHCYEGDGWYFDGNPGQKDYYIPFAMHYYGLIYAKQMEEIDAEYCSLLRHRAENFYSDFIYWFGRDGREVPYGRSLTYRFAHSAAFAAMAFAGVNVPMGELKHFVLGNLRYWSSQPILDCSGILTIGYQYPNLIMSERYNAPGSPYWSFKTFLILALSEDHPFWQAEEMRPELEDKKLLAHPYMIAVHEESGHTLLYPTGQHSGNFGNTAAKYQKFVYSNLFGFSVSRGTDLEDGAFDNTLAATRAGENCWRMRSEIKEYEVTEEHTRTVYELLPGVTVESLIIPQAPGHIRIHHIKTAEDIELADGGFAIRKEDGMERMSTSMIQVREREVHCLFPWGNAGAVNMEGGGEAKLITPFPNTNLMYGITVIPTICFKLKAGEYCLKNYFYGDGTRETGRGYSNEYLFSIVKEMV